MTRLEATPTALVCPEFRAGELAMCVRPLRACVRLQIVRAEARHSSHISIAGIPLPLTPNRVAEQDPCLMWVAPDSWLLISEQVDSDDLLRKVASACRDTVHAATDASQGLERIAINGAHARALLVHSCGLDMTGESFSPGRCASTRLAQITVLIRSIDANSFELYVDASHALWLWDWLVDATIDNC